jgi:hypothetical protein
MNIRLRMLAIRKRMHIVKGLASLNLDQSTTSFTEG